MQFGRVLDQDQSFVRRNLADQRVEEGRLAGRGATRHQDVLARLDRSREHPRHVAGIEHPRQFHVDR